MKIAIKMDSAGRLVLPKSLRERLSLKGGATLNAEVVSGRVELTPVDATESLPLLRKRGILVLPRAGAPVDAGAAVAAERDDQEERGLRR
jgi:AbrB family looped-hinge helix DNA binding protein